MEKKIDLPVPEVNEHKGQGTVFNGTKEDKIQPTEPLQNPESELRTDEDHKSKSNSDSDLNNNIENGAIGNRNSDSNNNNSGYVDGDSKPKELREPHIQQAVAFLKSPNVRQSTKEKQRAFLLSKGLTEDEIIASYERALEESSHPSL